MKAHLALPPIEEEKREEVPVKLKREIYEKLKEIADKENVSVARLTNELLAELLAIMTSSKITGYKRIIEEREGRKLTLREYVDKLVDLAHSYTLCEKEKKAIVERYAKLRSKLTNLSYHITKLKYT